MLRWPIISTSCILKDELQNMRSEVDSEISYDEALHIQYSCFTKEQNYFLSRGI